MWIGYGILFSVVTHPVLSCLHGWVRNEGSCYHVSRDLATWIEASRMCEIHGGMLAHVETSSEQLFLNGIVAHFRDDHLFWLGASDWGKEGEWIWEPDGRQVNYTNWAHGQPNNVGRIEHCLLMNRILRDKWDDRDCHGAHHYICEMS